MDRTKNIFVQGAADPDIEAQATITMLGEFLKKQGSRCHVGSRGAIPDILEKIDVQCTRYAFKNGRIDEYTWTNRLADWVTPCEAFVFFKGDAGTLAHLMPVLAFSKKMWTKKDGPRKVVLIGWTRSEVAAIEMLMGLDNPEWFASFSYKEIDQATAFLK